MTDELKAATGREPIRFKVEGEIDPVCVTAHCNRPAVHVVIGITMGKLAEGQAREHAFGLCDACTVSIKPGPGAGIQGKGTPDPQRIVKMFDDGIKIGEQLGSLLVKIFGAKRKP